MKKPAKLPYVLLEERKTVGDMMPGEEGFISKGAVVVDPESQETWVWADARVGPRIIVDGAVYAKRRKNGLSLLISAISVIDPREQVEEQKYIPVLDIKFVDLEELQKLSPVAG